MALFIGSGSEIVSSLIHDLQGEVKQRRHGETLEDLVDGGSRSQR
jgi:hypothetical protein